MISTETQQRRRMTTPAYLAANIMAAIPEARTEISTATATSTATLVESRSALPMTMVLMLGAGVFAIGIVIGKML
jgi:hypothetical protein